jgi:hypothetical protein
MDATDGARAFSIWSRATFRATAFVAGIVFLSYRTYGLRDALRSSSTAFGLTSFAVLWTATVFATRGQERGFLRSAREDSVATTVVAGGLNGLFVLAALIVAAVGRVILTPPGAGSHAAPDPGTLSPHRAINPRNSTGGGHVMARRSVVSG